MNFRSLIKTAIACGLTSSLFAANEISFDEKFNLDRPQALKELIPGSRDYFYYNCLHQQHLNNFPQTETLLKQWSKKHGETSRMREILNRQALLTYKQNPQKTLDYLRRRLGLSFHHQRIEQNPQHSYPAALDQNLFSWPTLQKEGLRRNSRSTSPFSEQALQKLAKVNLNHYQTHDLLRRLQRPDLDNLENLILKDIQSKYTGGFGSLPLHTRLLKTQMDNLLAKQPKLINDSRFINAYSLMLPTAKILSYIANMRKIISACPWCYDNNSLILPPDAKETHKHKCDHCRREFSIDLKTLEHL